VLAPQAQVEAPEDDEDTETKQVSGKFSFTFNIKDHKRSGLISTSLIDIDGSDNGISKRNVEVSMLNDVLALEAKRLRKKQELRRDEMKKGIAVTLGFDGNGESAFIVDAEFDISWVRFLSALKTLGFTIDDRDSSAGTIYAKYNGVESSFFGSLIGSEDDLPIDKQTYHIQLGDLGKKTTIAFLDDEDIPMSAKFMSDIHQAFADSMADDSLKIK
jgi:outer membrane protein assembly factor BamC